MSRQLCSYRYAFEYRVQKTGDTEGSSDYSNGEKYLLEGRSSEYAMVEYQD